MVKNRTELNCKYDREKFSRHAEIARDFLKHTQFTNFIGLSCSLSAQTSYNSDNGKMKDSVRAHAG